MIEDEIRLLMRSAVAGVWAAGLSGLTEVPRVHRGDDHDPGGGEARLRALADDAAACTQCDLCHSRHHTVFGEGSPHARLMFVGEAPGHQEDRQGKPFVGQAGAMLTRIITAMGMQRDAVYIANVVKCRPPANRTPSRHEAAACFSFLKLQIQLVQPDVIVALGAVASRTLLQSEEGIARLRGTFHHFENIPVMPTFHPAYLLRNPSDKFKVWEDMKQVMALLASQPM